MSDLREFEPSTSEYTGREIRFLVSYMLTWPVFGLAAGWSILGLAERLPRATGDGT